MLFSWIFIIYTNLFKQIEWMQIKLLLVIILSDFPEFWEMYKSP